LPKLKGNTEGGSGYGEAKTEPEEKREDGKRKAKTKGPAVM